MLTYNIHGARPIHGPPDLPAIAAVLREADADVAGLQEVHRWLPPPGIWQDQAGALARRTERHSTFLPSFGLPWSGYGNLLLTRDAPQSAVRHFLPSGTEPRALVLAGLEHGGIPFRLGLTHLGLSRAERQAQVHAILTALGTESVPTVLLGDWNAGPDAPELVPLLEAGYAHAAPHGILTFPSNAPDRQIDHIVVSPHWQVERCWTILTPASDHLPMAAELRYIG